MKYELITGKLVGIPQGTVYERIESMSGPQWFTEDGECVEWLSKFLEYHAGLKQFSPYVAQIQEEVLPVAENGLNSLQNAHKKEILKLANRKINEKYIAGALEHQTNLKDDTTEDQLIEFMLEEAIDQVVYVLTLMQKRGLV